MCFLVYKCSRNAWLNSGTVPPPKKDVVCSTHSVHNPQWKALYLHSYMDCTPSEKFSDMRAYPEQDVTGSSIWKAGSHFWEAKTVLDKRHDVSALHPVLGLFMVHSTAYVHQQVAFTLASCHCCHLSLLQSTLKCRISYLSLSLSTSLLKFYNWPLTSTPASRSLHMGQPPCCGCFHKCLWLYNEP